MQRRQVPVEKLEFGMYVAELDRPWTETPFMFQGFHLRTEEQLAMLRQHCKHVFVDPERTEAAESPRRVVAGSPRSAAAESPRSAVPAANFKIRGSTRYPEAKPVEVEFRDAHTAYSRSITHIGELLSPVARPGGVLDGREIQESVTRLTDSVVRNPDALLLVTRLREKSAQAHARSLQVSIYLMVFGRFLELAREELELLGLLGLLQDVGKTRLPAGLLEKSTPLSPEEIALVRRHVEFSAEILRATPGLPERLPALVTLHHERQDGSGYPGGLKGDQIGLYGSMAAIADAFDALTATRPYAEPLSPSSALSYLYKERGTGFHTELVEQFIQCVGVFPVGSVVELNSGEIGIVITQNLVRRLKPRVMVVLDAQGHAVHPHRILDLDKDPKVRPDEPYRIRRTMEQTKLQIDPRELFA